MRGNLTIPSSSELDANLGLVPMHREQYKSTMQVVRKPKSGFKIVLESLFYSIVGGLNCYLFVYAVFFN